MHNVSFKQQDMHNLISAAYKNITVDNWIHYVNHVKKIEEDLWKADELQDDDEQFLIRPPLHHHHHRSQTQIRIRILHRRHHDLQKKGYFHSLKAAIVIEVSLYGIL